MYVRDVVNDCEVGLSTLPTDAAVKRADWYEFKNVSVTPEGDNQRHTTHKNEWKTQGSRSAHRPNGAPCHTCKNTPHIILTVAGLSQPLCARISEHQSPVKMSRLSASSETELGYRLCDHAS